MTTMIEKVARALCTMDWNYVSDESLGSFDPDLTKDEWRKMARRAIEAMREPTEAMRGAGVADSEYGAVRYEIPNEEISRIFTAMIDAALNERESK